MFIGLSVFYSETTKFDDSYFFKPKILVINTVGLTDSSLILPKILYFILINNYNFVLNVIKVKRLQTA